MALLNDVAEAFLQVYLAKTYGHRYDRIRAMRRDVEP